MTERQTKKHFKKRSKSAVSPVISTIIISSTLLIILLIASFVSTNLLELQLANTEFEQAKTNMLLLNKIIQDVALRPGATSSIQFNQRSGGIGIYRSTENLIIEAIGTESQTLRPNADGTYQEWTAFGGSGEHWQLTSDQNNATGVQITGNTTALETENLEDLTQAGEEIISVTAYIKAKAVGVEHKIWPISNMNFTNDDSDWTTTVIIYDGSASCGYDNSTGNLYGAGSYYHQANYTKDEPQTNVVFISETSFSYTNGTPARAYLSYAYAVSYEVIGHGGGNININGNITIRLVKPDNTVVDLDSESFTSEVNWKYKTGIVIAVANFAASGTYKLQVISNLSIQGNKDSYIKLNFDDVGLELSIPDSEPEKAVIVWRTHGNNYESSSSFTVSRGDFTIHSETRTVNPYTQNSWTQNEVNSLEIGVRASALGENETIQVSEIWITVVYVSGQADVLYNSTERGGLYTLAYRGGSRASAAETILAGTQSLRVSMSSSLGCVRVETGNGVWIILDYSRVRIVTNTVLRVGGTQYNLTEIFIIRLEPGSTGGSGTVTVKVQNIGFNSETYIYERGTLILRIKVGSRQEELNLSSETLKPIVRITEAVIRVSIS